MNQLTNFYKLFLCSAPTTTLTRHRTAAAVIVPATGQRVSYRTMVDQSKRLANVLRSRGLRPGDHVAIFMTNVPEYFEVVWAARRGRLLLHRRQLAPHPG